MPIDRDVFLAVRSRSPGRSGWLTIDLGTGEQVRVVSSLEDLGRQCAGCQAAVAGLSEPVELAGEGAAFPDVWLWSLLDPLGAGQGSGLFTGDEIEDETALRQAVRRLRARLAWWGSRSFPESPARAPRAENSRKCMGVNGSSAPPITAASMIPLRII